MLRGAALGDEAFDNGDQRVGVAGAPHPHGQRLPGELVDDVEELEPATVGGLVELEVDRPHMVRVLSGEALGNVAADPPALATAHRTAQPLVAPAAWYAWR